ncbi:MAG: hypothetical protein ABIQ24_05440 [Nitrospiraceae bacterium]
MKRFYAASGVADMESSDDDYSQRLGCRPDLLIPGKYAFDSESGHEEDGARRGHGSGDVVRSGDAIQQ